MSVIINKSASELRIGDIGFARTKGFMGRLIRLGEWLKFRSCDFNHTFVVVSTGLSYNDTWIVQAELRGVSLRRLSEILPDASEIHIIHPPKGVDGLKVAEFALRQLGDPYGLVTILCIALDITTPDWFLEFRRNWSWICSALTGESLRYAGWLFDFKDIYTVTPTELWKAVNAYNGNTGTCPSQRLA